MAGYHIQFNMINFKKVGIIFLASGFILSGCTTKDNSNSSTPVEKKEIKAISLEDFTKNLSNSEYQFIDTRDDEAYNGFKVDNVKNGGHLKNSIQYSASFIGKVNKNKEAKFISDKGLDKNKKIVVYDTNKDNIEKAEKKGIKLVSIRSWDEYTGKTSGYDYIDKKGEPKGLSTDFLVLMLLIWMTITIQMVHYVIHKKSINYGKAKVFLKQIRLQFIAELGGETLSLGL